MCSNQVFIARYFIKSDIESGVVKDIEMILCQNFFSEKCSGKYKWPQTTAVVLSWYMIIAEWKEATVLGKKKTTSHLSWTY